MPKAIRRKQRSVRIYVFRRRRTSPKKSFKCEWYISCFPTLTYDILLLFALLRSIFRPKCTHTHTHIHTRIHQARQGWWSFGKGNDIPGTRRAHHVDCLGHGRQGRSEKGWSRCLGISTIAGLYDGLFGLFKGGRHCRPRLSTESHTTWYVANVCQDCSWLWSASGLDQFGIQLHEKNGRHQRGIWKIKATTFDCVRRVARESELGIDGWQSQIIIVGIISNCRPGTFGYRLFAIYIRCVMEWSCCVLMKNTDFYKLQHLSILLSSRNLTKFHFLFFSGSTSDPKGVMITHGNLGHNLTMITNELKAVTDTIVVSWVRVAFPCCCCWCCCQDRFLLSFVLSHYKVFYSCRFDYVYSYLNIMTWYVVESEKVYLVHTHTHPFLKAKRFFRGSFHYSPRGWLDHTWVPCIVVVGGITCRPCHFCRDPCCG